MKQFILTMLLLAAAVCAANAAVRGDVDGNGVVDVDDMNIIINVMLGKGQHDNADVNGSGVVDVDDLNVVINVMLGKDPGGDVPTTTYTVNGVSFKMVAVEGCTFTMGAAEGDEGDIYGDQKPAHQVTLSDYSIGQTEVTQELWLAVMGENAAWYRGDHGYEENLQRPVECVTWNQCNEFIDKLNQLTGESFRLPTEAEWEYAAKGGNKSKGYIYAGSNNVDDVAWYEENCYWGVGDLDRGTRPVATKVPNELGLYDMSGNVWEHCADWYGEYTAEPQTNPTGPEYGTVKVSRGGCWYSGSGGCRVLFRMPMYTPQSANDQVGFRLVK